MSRLFVAASGDNALIEQAALTAVPITMAAWVRSASDTGNDNILGIGEAAGSSYFQLSQTGADNLLFRTQDSGGGSQATGGTMPIGPAPWQHVVGLSAASNSRYAFLNGVKSSQNTGDRTPTNLDRTVFGSRVTDLGAPWDGDIAWAAIWNVALTDAEVLRLSTGVVPLLVRKESIVACWPLWGIHDPEIDLVGSFDLTLTGTTRGDDPPTSKISRSLIGRDDLIKYVNGGMVR